MIEITTLSTIYMSGFVLFLTVPFSPTVKHALFCWLAAFVIFMCILAIFTVIFVFLPINRCTTGVVRMHLYTCTG